MALVNFYDALILYGPYDISADHNEVTLEHKADMLEMTRFGNTEHRFKSGLLEGTVSGKGFLSIDDSTTPKAADKNLFDEIAATAKAFTIAPSTADGEIAWLMQGVEDNYSWTMKNDSLGMFDFSVKSGGKGPVRGRIMMPLSTLTATTTGSIYQLGAVTAAQKVYANLHVTEFTGTSLDAVLYSNDTNNTTTPTARVTFTQATGATSEYKETAGAITDTYWYVVFTFVGTSFKASVSAGIK